MAGQLPEAPADFPQGARLRSRRTVHMARVRGCQAAGRPAVALLQRVAAQPAKRASGCIGLRQTGYSCPAAKLPGHLWSSGYDVSLTR